MTREEYTDLFHKARVNLVAFKPVFHCDLELMRMVELAVEAEREACVELIPPQYYELRDRIRARKNT